MFRKKEWDLVHRSYEDLCGETMIHYPEGHDPRNDENPLHTNPRAEYRTLNMGPNIEEDVVWLGCQLPPYTLGNTY